MDSSSFYIFRVGDKVAWQSQSKGFRTSKKGVIVAVVKPGNRPDRKAFPDLYGYSAYGKCGAERSKISYVVRVGNKHYWPRARHLLFDWE